MATFLPEPGDTIGIGGSSHTFNPHPQVPYMAFGQEGAKAIVFQTEANNRLYALKQFKHFYRRPEIEDICQTLARYKLLPGLEVCERLCLTTQNNRQLIQQYLSKLPKVFRTFNNTGASE